MANLFLFLSGIFFVTLVLGKLIEKIRVPWIFSALALGFLLAVHNPFTTITSSPEFNFLAQLGMYFLLFVIGFELDLNKLKAHSKFIFKATFFIIFLESLCGTLLIYLIFGYGWIISFVVALSFATVGEAILVPILDEFKIVNTKLGQSIIGIGALDDIIEVSTLVAIILLIGLDTATSRISIISVLGSLLILFFLAFGLTKLKQRRRRFSFSGIESLFVFVLSIFFLFLGIGEYAYASAIGALLSGVALRTFLPPKNLRLVESEVKTMCYGFFAPVFFVWVGIAMDISYLMAYPLLVLLVAAASKGAKILGSLLVASNELGKKEAILLGIGISVRFSTSIIIVKMLFENHLIGTDLYSVIIASSIAFKFIVPVLFSNLLARWKISEA